MFYRSPGKFYPTAERAEGVYIYDTEGKRYLDGSGGAVVVGIGHGVKEVADAMHKQAGRIAFAHGSQFTTEAAIELASKIVKFSPAGLTRVYFLSGGSEAIETAVEPMYTAGRFLTGSSPSRTVMSFAVYVAAKQNLLST